MNHALCSATILLFANVLVFPIYAVSEETTNMKEHREFGEETEGQAISIRTKKTFFSPGERIDLTISLKNVSEEDIRVLKTAPLASHDIQVMAPNKGKAPSTLYGKAYMESSREGSRSVGILKPGEEESIDVHLSRLFDFTLSGQYTVSVQRVVWRKDGDPKGSKAISNSITITIGEDLGSDPQR